MRLLAIVSTLLLPLIVATSLVSVKNVTLLGAQVSPDVEEVSRDGGYSVLINGNIVWLYDDTECFDSTHTQLSFISNTGSFGDRSNVSLVADPLAKTIGKDPNGKDKKAILPGTTVGSGAWVPFQRDELRFNDDKKGRERVAIWPGTSPTSISTTQAFLFAPLVYVDCKPKDPTKQYQSRGMTLITIEAPSSGPVASRKRDLAIAGTEVPFGGFATLIGYKSIAKRGGENDRDVYLLGMTSHGLQLARVDINDITDYNKFTFYDPKERTFVDDPPSIDLSDADRIYLPGTFSSGNIFYSPYFATFVIIYFNMMADSVFYIRYLDLDKPLTADATWIRGGKLGVGIVPEDVEALLMYPWSAEEKLYASPVIKGFNYAGMPHPEYFNRHYFPPTLYPPGTPSARRINDWFGGGTIAETNAGIDGQHLLLSWTSQLESGTDTGIYHVHLASVEFDDLDDTTRPWSSPPARTSPTSTGHRPLSTALNMVRKGASGPRLHAFVDFPSGRVSGTLATLLRWGGLIGVWGVAEALIPCP